MPRASGTKKSSNPKTTGRDRTGMPTGTPPRAHRDDTPEAKAQHKMTAKTHPTSGANKHGARRHGDERH